MLVSPSKLNHFKGNMSYGNVSYFLSHKCTYCIEVGTCILKKVEFVTCVLVLVLYSKMAELFFVRGAWRPATSFWLLLTTKQARLRFSSGMACYPKKCI